MKIKTRNIILTFNKETIANLELVQMNEARGGTGHDSVSPCQDPLKPTQSCAVNCSLVC